MAKVFNQTVVEGLLIDLITSMKQLGYDATTTEKGIHFTMSRNFFKTNYHYIFDIVFHLNDTKEKDDFLVTTRNLYTPSEYEGKAKAVDIRNDQIPLFCRNYTKIITNLDKVYKIFHKLLEHKDEINIALRCRAGEWK